jgi:hypothetical protein
MINQKHRFIMYRLFFVPMNLMVFQELGSEALRVLAWRWEGLVSFHCSWVRVLMRTPVTSAVSYMPTGFAGCLVGRGISRGARKLARTPT